jgi:5-methylcytosine-specific restriction endonuclease McrA
LRQRTHFSPRKRKLIAAKSNGQCAECRSGENLTIDHIVPLPKGGSNGLSNLRLLCGLCNVEKGSELPDREDLPKRLRRALHRAHVEETKAREL